MGKNERKVVELDDYEYRVMIEALADIDAPVIVRGRKSAARDSR